MRHLGFFVKRLDSNLVNLANALPTVLENAIFYDEWVLPEITPKVSLLKTKDCWGFDGNLICFDLWAANFAVQFPKVKNIYLCANTKQWLNQNVSFEFLHNIYMNPIVELLVSSETDAQSMESIWKKPLAVVEKFGINHFVEALEKIYGRNH